MSDVLTWEEIQRCYPDEWVLLADIVDDASGNLCGGRLVFHSPNRDEVWAKSEEMDRTEFGINFTGDLDPELVFVFDYRGSSQGDCRTQPFPGGRRDLYWSHERRSDLGRDPAPLPR